MIEMTSTIAAAPSGPPQNTPAKKPIWTSLLNSVSSGKRLAEKQLVVLGGSPESQREFIASLETEAKVTLSSRNLSAQKPPIANDLALGYTYQDVLDTDHQDILARLSIFTLAAPSKLYLPLLSSLFTPKSIPNTLLVILLDWSEPWNWIRQLQQCITLLEALLEISSPEMIAALSKNIKDWRETKRNRAKDLAAGQDGPVKHPDADVALPLGPGEWDMPLGLPLNVVCQNANKIEYLEKEFGYREFHFDFIQQFLRTILLKHGASLIYTMPHLAGNGTGTGSTSNLQTLIHSSLGIRSLLQKATIKYNTTERDHILIPHNFDSWGKIRILTADFDVESVARAWTSDVTDGIPDSHQDQDQYHDQSQSHDGSFETPAQLPSLDKNTFHSAVLMYEGFIKNPRKIPLLSLDDTQLKKTTAMSKDGVEVESKEVQTFLGEQAEKLENLAKEDEQQLMRDTVKKPTPPGPSAILTAADIQEHIGNVPVNFGGIQMDVDQALKQLNQRCETVATPASKSPPQQQQQNQQQPLEDSVASPPKVDEKGLSEMYRSFFAGLTKKPGGGGAATTYSPRRSGEGSAP